MATSLRPRLMDGMLTEYLETFGAVYIRGPKWCGKTTTAGRKAGSVLWMQDADHAQTYRELAALFPSRLLEGATPRLIDEWQTAPALWDAVRFEVDKRGDVGQFILTGSAVAGRENVSHSGTGRIATLDMHPMTLLESRESSAAVSCSAYLTDSRWRVLAARWIWKAWLLPFVVAAVPRRWGKASVLPCSSHKVMWIPYVRMTQAGWTARKKTRAVCAPCCSPMPATYPRWRPTARSCGICR